MPILLASAAINIIGKASNLFPKKPSECSVLCIPTASKVEDGPKDWLDNELNEFKKTGYDLVFFDIDGASEKDVMEKLEKADIIYVTGGNTYFLLEKMQACGFEKSSKAALSRGATYIGSSAGSIVCCPDIAYIDDMDEAGKANLENTHGLNLVDFFVMVHMDHPDFSSAANACVSRLKKSDRVICLNDNQALYVDDQVISIIAG